INNIVEYINQEEKKKGNWTENLRYETQKIKFKETIHKMNITENNLSYESRKIFNKVFEKDISSKKKEKNICQNNGEEIKDDGNYVTASYKTNKELKKQKYENILINKIKNKGEFFLSNFAVPLESPLYIKGGEN
ncbi:hypothetical protein PFLG_02590, partial [Plasmodium falciparum RAJ116]